MSAYEVTKSKIEENDIQDNIRTTYIRKIRKGIILIHCVCSATALQHVIGKKIISDGKGSSFYEDLDVPRSFICCNFYHKKFSRTTSLPILWRGTWRILDIYNDNGKPITRNKEMVNIFVMNSSLA